MSEGKKILLICDDEVLAKGLEDKLTLDGGYSMQLENNGKSGLDIFEKQNFEIVIVQFGMGDLEAGSLIKGLKKRDPNAIIILLIKENVLEALRETSGLGVYNFINLPINSDRLFFLVRSGIELRTLMVAHQKLAQSLQEHNVDLQKQNNLLARRIEESARNLTRLYEDLRSTYLRTIKALAQAIDARDHYTHSHSENVVKYALAIASEMGLSFNDKEAIREACELHDLGKIGIQDNVLTKPAALDKEEWDKVKLHPAIGAQILQPLTFLGGVTELVRQHHEHYDGSGYPEGRRQDEILLGARIINLADAYDAMRSPRAYRKNPLTKEEAIFEIKQNSGKQFDPKVVETFLKVVDKL